MKGNRRSWIQALLASGIVLLLAAFWPWSIAGATTPTPDVFFGKVFINGSLAGGGQAVQARIGNVNYANSEDTARVTNVASDGTYGSVLAGNFHVCVDSTDTSAKEGGNNGDVIEFFVDNRKASTRLPQFLGGAIVDPVVFQTANSTELDLHVSTTISTPLGATPNSAACTSGDEVTPPPAPPPVIIVVPPEEEEAAPTPTPLPVEVIAIEALAAAAELIAQADLAEAIVAAIAVTGDLSALAEALSAAAAVSAEGLDAVAMALAELTAGSAQEVAKDSIALASAVVGGIASEKGAAILARLHPDVAAAILSELDPLLAAAIDYWLNPPDKIGGVVTTIEEGPESRAEGSALSTGGTAAVASAVAGAFAALAVGGLVSQKAAQREALVSRSKGKRPQARALEKGEVRRTRLLRPHSAWVVMAAVALLAVAIIDPGKREAAEPKTAAIVDQLSLTVPNPDFVASATGLLQQAGYLVDYYEGEQVTVDFYRDLPKLDYDLMILRVHVGTTRRTDSKTGEVTWPEYVSIFTGEPSAGPYKYPRQGVGEGTTYPGGPLLYAITAGFVEWTMRGEFDDTLIVMMGCDGLGTTRTARAFLDRGAQSFVGWSDDVSARHTDAATERLLERLLTQGLDLEEAVAQTGAEIGPDPWYGGELHVLSGRS